jgi:hypothetical protein
LIPSHVWWAPTIYVPFIFFFTFFSDQCYSKIFIAWSLFPSPHCSWYGNIWHRIIFLHIFVISCFVTNIISLVAYNILIH